MKNNIKRIASAMLVLVALATLSFMAKDGVTLRLRPQLGKTYTITSKVNMIMLMEAQGQTMNLAQNQETRQSFTVIETSEAQSTFETQIEDIKMTMTQMGMKLEYDSEHPEKTSPMLAGQTKVIEKNLKKPFIVTYDALGNTIDSIKPDLNQFGSAIGGAIIKLPEEELAVGSTWNLEISQNINGFQSYGIEIKANMTYTVTAISKKSVNVSVAGTLKGSNEISGTYEGTASFNPQTGLVMNSSAKSNISMTINEQGVGIPMTMVGNTTVDVK